MAELLLEVNNLRFRYQQMTMCFDLQLADAECMAVIGPSGAGKSTLLALIAGFETPLAGSVRIAGRDITRLSPAQRPLSMVFQEHNLFAHLNVATNVGLGIHPGLKLNAQEREQVAAALAQVGLSGLDKRLPAQLSGGQRQRVALARCLVRRQPLLLLDEPFAALGPALRAEMLDLVATLQRSRALGVLLVSHHPADARRIAARTAFVCDGRILAVDATEQLLQRKDLPALQEYLGQMPWMP